MTYAQLSMSFECPDWLNHFGKPLLFLKKYFRNLYLNLKRLGEAANKLYINQPSYEWFSETFSWFRNRFSK